MMLLLLGILKRNNKYYMNVVNTDKENSMDNYQYINLYLLSNCVNVNVQRFLSNKQNPIEYLRGDFDVSKIIVDDDKLRNRINDFQIISIYYDEDNKPCLYKSINRAGIISMHDISEFGYTKTYSILGNDLNNLPHFVEKRPLEEAYEYLNKNLDVNNLADIPVRMARHYLVGIKGFKEGYHTVTKVNNGIELEIHEYMLFDGTASIKLIEYIPKNKKTYLTKQDDLSNPYPKERTVGYSSCPIIILGSGRVVKRFFKIGVNTEFAYYNDKVIKLHIPFSSNILNMYDKYIKSKDIFSIWRLDFNKNITKDIYKNVLPNEIYELPNKLCRDMRNLPYNAKHSYQLERENDNIERWIHTVSLFICWQYFSYKFKKRIKLIMENYQDMYACALKNLVDDLGPRDTLLVMKWTKEHLKDEMKNILNSDTSIIDDNSCLFTFHQNNYDLPENLRVYSEETIMKYGGVDKLKEDFATLGREKRNFIIKTLEDIANGSQEKASNLLIESEINNSIKRYLRFRI